MKTEANFAIRNFRSTDRGAVVRLLSGIGEAYPRGMDWLDLRLDQALLRKADAWLVTDARGEISAIAIITSKGKWRSKLSTLLVDQRKRYNGLGTWILDQISLNWLRSSKREGSVTVNFNDVSTMNFFANRSGFELFAVEADLYGPGRDEAIFVWSPENATSYFKCVGF